MSSQGTESRKVIKTYVPKDQKEEWLDHAVELNMSQSEYARTMIQAGRRSFSLDPDPDTDDTTDTESTGSDLQARIKAILAENEALEWDALVGELTERVEEELDDALEELQETNQVRYSGRSGGYTLQE